MAVDRHVQNNPWWIVFAALMGLVVEYRPNDYMALYHAGMAEYGIEKMDLARAHLERFMKLYPAEDGWRGSARATLAKLPVPLGP